MSRVSAMETKSSAPGAGEHFQLPASSLHTPPPRLLPALTKQAHLFSEGKVRSRWQLIEKQQFAFDNKRCPLKMSFLRFFF